MTNLDAVSLYKMAYDNHYKKRNYKKAYALYSMLISEYPDTKEANYSRSQLENIQNMPGFEPTAEEEIKGVQSQVTQEMQELNERLTSIKDSPFLMTTGFNFEGYSIQKYMEVIAAESVLGTGFMSEIGSSLSDFLGVESEEFSNKLSRARESATQKLIQKAKRLTSNAIIGVDYDYVVFGKNIVGVIANGTAVYVKSNN